VSNAALAVGKILAGLFCFSQAILADGFHSASDLATDAVVLAGLRVAGRPADHDHHYGHERVATLVALFVAVGLLGAASWIGYRALVTIQEPTERIRPNLPFYLAAASVPLKELLFHVTRFVGRRTGNLSVTANAWHHRSDAAASLAAAAGLAGVALGGPKWHFLDHVTAVVLAAFLTLVAVRIAGSAASELIDAAPSAATLDSIRQTVQRTDGVRSYHAFRARESGGKVSMDIHVQVDPDLTVREGHDIASEVKRAVMRADRKVVEVIVHIEPAEDDT
jgi:cation diffusion facilitator family transporter